MSEADGAVCVSILHPSSLGFHHQRLLRDAGSVEGRLIFKAQTFFPIIYLALYAKKYFAIAGQIAFVVFRERDSLRTDLS